MSEKQNKNVTVRVQKIKKNHIKQKLIFFLILAIGLVILAIFSEHLCPYDPYAQDLASALQPPSLQHPMGTDTYGRDMLSRVRNSCGCMLRIFWRSCRCCYDEDFRCMSCFPWACICHGDRGYSWGRHSECCYSTGSSKLAEIFTYCQRADSGIKRGTLYSCCHTCR